MMTSSFIIDHADSVLENKVDFELGLADVMASAKTPWQLLEKLRPFLERHSEKSLPSPGDLACATITLSQGIREEIKGQLKGEKVFAMLVETTDGVGRAMTAVFVGPLNGTFREHPHLFELVDVTFPNHEQITRLVCKVIYQLHDERDDREDFLLLLTNDDSHFIKAGADLRREYPNLIHVTCLAQGLHRVAEFVRTQHPDVDRLIAETTRIFVNCKRQQLWFANKTRLPLPPDPASTCWSSWLKAVFYYGQHFTAIKGFVEGLEADTTAIERSQQLFLDKTIQSQLERVTSDFKWFAKSLTKIQVRQSMTESVFLFTRTEFSVKISPFKEKFEAVRKNNPGFEEILRLDKVVHCPHPARPPSNPTNAQYFKCAPLVTCDVERVLSRMMTELIAPSPDSLPAALVREYLIVSWSKNRLCHKKREI